MEAVAGGAAVIAVLNLSKDVIEWTFKYGNDVSHASKEASEVSDLLEVLNQVLETLKTLHSSQVVDLVRRSLEMCEADLSEIQKKLYIGTGATKIVRSLKWPFRQKDLRQFLEKIKMYIQIFELALTREGIARLEKLDQLSTNTDDIRGLVVQMNESVLDTNKILQAQHSDETSLQKDKILEWLLNVNFKSNHTAACRKYQPSTGDWFLSGHDFATWVDNLGANENPEKRLWLSGIAGTGKTILMSAVITAAKNRIDYLRIKSQTDPGIGLAFFYFDFNDMSKRNVSNMLSSLIWQLLDELGSIPTCVVDLRRETPKGEVPDVDSLLTCVVKLSSCFKSTMIFLNALDEAFPSSDILDIITRLNTTLPGSARVLVSSRDELHIQTVLWSCRFSQVKIPRSKVDHDIATYITKRINTDLKDQFESFSHPLRRDIYQTLTSQASGMFLWARLQLNEIFRRYAESDIRQVLETMPTDLNATYKRIGQEIDAPHRKYVKRTMLWLIASLEPMSRENLSEALMIDLDTFNIHPKDRLLDANSILEMCRSLVSMQDDGSVSLVHLSLKHFLVSGDAGDFGINSTKNVHSVAAQACFAYLTSGRHDSLSWAESRGLEHYKRYRQAEREISFLDYCCRNVFGHLKQDQDAELEFVDLLPRLFQTTESQQHFKESSKFWEAHSEYLPEYRSFQKETNFFLIFGPSTAKASYGSLKLCWDSSLTSRLVVAETKVLIADSIRRSLEFIEQDEQGWSAICFVAALEQCSALESMISKLSESSQNIPKPLGSALIVALGCGKRASMSLLLDTFQARADAFDSQIVSFLYGILIILACIMGEHQVVEKLLAGSLTGNDSPSDREELQIALVAAALEGHEQCVTEILNSGVKPWTKINPVRYQALWHADQERLFLVANTLWIGRDIPQPQSEENVDSVADSDSDSDFELEHGMLGGAKSAISAAVARGHRQMIETLSARYANKFELIPDYKRDTSFSYTKPKADPFEAVEPVVTRLLETSERPHTHNVKLDQLLLWCTAKKERYEILNKALRSRCKCN